LSNVVTNENAAAQTVALTGISSGATNENQTLTVTATSSNPALIPNPTVNYTSPNTAGSITFAPVAKNFGTNVITVTVNDGGTNNNIITRTFTVTVNHVNQTPTLNGLGNVVINENAAAQTMALTGISSGAANENQTLTVTASSSNLPLIPNATVNYTSANTAGSITFAPVAKTFGTTVISVTVNDGGTSNNIITRTFTVTVNPVNQQPTLIPLGNVVINENAAAQTVALTGISSGAANENQTLTVTASSSNLPLIPNATVNYTSPNPAGSLVFAPAANTSGLATISVTVNDGGASNNIITRTFSITVKVPDAIKPTMSIVSPTANQRLTNGAFTVTGNAADNVAVGNVFYSLNGSGWSSATTANNWTNWSGSLALAPGTNTLQAYAADTSGNCSATNTVKIEYVVLMPVVAQVYGLGVPNPKWGSLRPNYSGQTLLAVNEKSQVTAKASHGFALTNWTDGSGKILTNGTTLRFTMAPNLSLRANFVDIIKPILRIVTPKAKQKLTSGTLTVTGKVADNVAVGTVYCSLNGSAWTAAALTNNSSHWSATVALTPGNNVLQAYAVDTSGNRSTTHSVAFEYQVTSKSSSTLMDDQEVPVTLEAVTAPANGQFALSVTGTAGRIYVLQVSTDLMNWTSVTTNQSPFIFVDTEADKYQQRFYRSFSQP
jgi:phosphoheptose isomerase